MPEAAQITELAVTWAAVARGSAGAAAQRHRVPSTPGTPQPACAARESRIQGGVDFSPQPPPPGRNDVWTDSHRGAPV